MLGHLCLTHKTLSSMPILKEGRRGRKKGGKKERNKQTFQTWEKFKNPGTERFNIHNKIYPRQDYHKKSSTLGTCSRIDHILTSKRSEQIYKVLSSALTDPKGMKLEIDLGVNKILHNKNTP